MAYEINEHLNTTEIVNPDRSILWPSIGKVESIEFIPGYAGNKCLIRDGGPTGPVVFFAKEATAGISARGAVKLYGQRIRPYIDYLDSAMFADSKIIIHWAEDGASKIPFELDGLIAHWPLTNQYEDGTYGAKDATPGGNHGTAVGGVSAGSLYTDFNGTTQYFTHTSQTYDIDGADYTFAFWAKKDDTGVIRAIAGSASAKPIFWASPRIFWKGLFSTNIRERM